jgi:hypothetical protein
VGEENGKAKKEEKNRTTQEIISVVEQSKAQYNEL